MQLRANWAVTLPALLLISTVYAIQVNQGKRITERTEVEYISYDVKYVFNPSMPRGDIKKVVYEITQVSAGIENIGEIFFVFLVINRSKNFILHYLAEADDCG